MFTQKCEEEQKKMISTDSNRPAGYSFGTAMTSIDPDKVAQEKRFDGCYIVTSDVDTDQMNTLEVVHAYKSLTFVERAFRNLKTVQLEIRPVYHKNDERIRSHVFLCMLAYYLQWHMEQRLASLFETDGKGQERRWTFRGVIDCLAQITGSLKFSVEKIPDANELRSSLCEHWHLEGRCR